MERDLGLWRGLRELNDDGFPIVEEEYMKSLSHVSISFVFIILSLKCILVGFHRDVRGNKVSRGVSLFVRWSLAREGALFASK